MDMTRRQTLLAGVGLLLTGCSAATSRYDRPDPWTVRSHTEYRRPTPTGSTPIAPVAPVTPALVGLSVVSRAQWTRSGPAAAKVNPMRSINRITVHHEGSTPVYFADTRSTAARLESIRRVHTGDRGWADIGYHYIVDRSGTVWEGRDARYQGAHVRQNNEHNLGILVLGNFDKQNPTDAQLITLENALRSFMSQHGVAGNRVFTHQEIVQTACPGRGLQSRMDGVRRHLA